ncbi:hypothetical protein H9638_13165 [Arthrobacter sp. Sa2BUA2]|uniref:Uncharacterized protein n=1 Tax=Arthrobacter pullicola TaxID=2762224 RepID=A0ABR8YKI4_9MICC|nr:hypothetical protein [Arthrobacter pullicola]MBD8044758.1 hypothetical protein [Arthrobacter pullicola]
MSRKRFWIITAVFLVLMMLAIVLVLVLDGGSINDPDFMCRFGMGRSSWVCDQS